MTKALFIYYTPDRKVFQVVRPSDKFENGWGALAEAVSGSNIRDGIKNYDHYEVK